MNRLRDLVARRGYTSLPQSSSTSNSPGSNSIAAWTSRICGSKRIRLVLFVAVLAVLGVVTLSRHPPALPSAYYGFGAHLPGASVPGWLHGGAKGDADVVGEEEHDVSDPAAEGHEGDELDVGEPGMPPALEEAPLVDNKDELSELEGEEGAPASHTSVREEATGAAAHMESTLAAGEPTKVPEAYQSKVKPHGDVPAVDAPGDVNWTQFAYTQYVTAPEHLCHAAMMFEALERLGSKTARSMLYPKEWDKDDSLSEEDKKLMRKAEKEYHVILDPIQVINGGGERTWAEGFTKFLIFRQHQFKRVLMLDSDGLLLQPMDELFLLPSAPVAIPRAYWLDKRPLSGQVMLAEPSEFEWKRIEAAIADHKETEFDMEIVDKLYHNDALVIPHRKYDLLSGEFKSDEDKHDRYLGSKEEKWDPDAIWAETKYVHFSDWPMPKPWVTPGDADKKDNQPKCRARGKGKKEDCRDREYWLRLYDDFADRREKICGHRFSQKKSRRA